MGLAGTNGKDRFKDDNSTPRFFIHEQKILKLVSAVCRDRERFVEVLEEEGIQAEAIQILTQGSSIPRD
jgi:hypothetical protein